MAIAYDNTTTNALASKGLSISWDHTATGSDLFVLVCLILDGATAPTITTATYDGNAMTLVQSYTGRVPVAMYYYIAPLTGAKTVSFAWSTPSEFAIGSAMSYTGVHQTTPVGTEAEANGQSGASTVDVSSAVGELVLSCNAVNGDEVAAQGGGQTERYDLNSGGSGGVSGNGAEEAGAGTVTMSTTHASQFWRIVGIPIKPAVADTTKVKDIIGLGIIPGPR